METKNKYYTPTIEEFHIGFECEYEVSDSWEPIIVGIEGAGHYNDIWCFEFSDYSSAVDTKSIRVKYLDKVDIEELGWEFDNESSIHGDPLYYIYNKEKYELSTWYRKEGILTRILITKKNDNNHILASHCIFYGYIKNKSELKVLLKQLGIA